LEFRFDDYLAGAVVGCTMVTFDIAVPFTKMVQTATDENDDKPIESCLEEGVAKHRWKKLLGNIDWNKLFKMVNSPSRTPLEQQLYWKLLHRKLPVKQYLKPKNNDPIVKHCLACQQEIESIEHVFYECLFAMKFWIKFREFLCKIVELVEDEFPPITQRDVVFFFPEFIDKLVVQELYCLSVCHSVALWVLWSVRDQMVSDGIIWQCFMSRLKARIFLDYESSIKEKSDDLDDLLEQGVDPIVNFYQTWCQSSFIKITRDGIWFAD
jgi:hypothetical protein